VRETGSYAPQIPLKYPSSTLLKCAAIVFVSPVLKVKRVIRKVSADPLPPRQTRGREVQQIQPELFRVREKRK